MRRFQAWIYRTLPTEAEGLKYEQQRKNYAKLGQLQKTETFWFKFTCNLLRKTKENTLKIGILETLLLTSSSRKE